MCTNVQIIQQCDMSLNLPISRNPFTVYRLYGYTCRALQLSLEHCAVKRDAVMVMVMVMVMVIEMVWGINQYFCRSPMANGWPVEKEGSVKTRSN